MTTRRKPPAKQNKDAEAAKPAAEAKKPEQSVSTPEKNADPAEGGTAPTGATSDGVAPVTKDADTPDPAAKPAAKTAAKPATKPAAPPEDPEEFWVIPEGRIRLHGKLRVPGDAFKLLAEEAQQLEDQDLVMIVGPVTPDD